MGRRHPEPQHQKQRHQIAHSRKHQAGMRSRQALVGAAVRFGGIPFREKHGRPNATNFPRSIMPHLMPHLMLAARRNGIDLS
jgi:hypothetical protein